MQTNLPPEFIATSRGQRADEILRSCVHCGFCNATCPTYQISGDELDGPRGRIYLIKELLEEGTNKARATQHLDRCLTCRACETTCPSGVAYGELAEIAREELGPTRPGVTGLMRVFLQWLIPNHRILRTMSYVGRYFKWLLPKPLASQVPSQISKTLSSQPSQSAHARKILLLQGCAQQVTTGDVNKSLVSLLDAHGIGVVTAPEEDCCGSLDLHLGDSAKANAAIRRNVDALLPLLQGRREGGVDAAEGAEGVEGVECIISTASGCGVTVKDYARILADDPKYADRAKVLSAKTYDISEYLSQANLPLTAKQPGQAIAWHPPCSLQHGQKITGVVESLLENAGYTLVPVADSHLCCGSAGTYSVLQYERGEALKKLKLDSLLAADPQVIVTANVGCQSHLATGTSHPVLHWIEMLK
ncbi:MAG: glycolate oxidase subunit GlcF [Gammaproteobacteria bacterium]|nr:glycolate oxidase subunit GlcF [Gammaproteobacteria bacterium]